MNPVRRGKTRRFIHPRWWLPLSVLASVVFHLLVGIGGQQLGWFSRPSEAPAASPDEGISVVLSPRPVERRPAGENRQPEPVPAAPAPEPAPSGPVQPIRPTRQPRRVAAQPTPIPDAPEAPEVTPDPLASRVLATPPPRPATVLTPRRPPTVRTTGGRLPDRVPEPLPRGDIRGSSTASAAPRAARVAESMPLVTQTPESSGGGGSGSGATPTPRRIVTEETTVRLPGAGENESPGSSGGEGGGSGGGRGERIGVAQGNGSGNGLGIDRGIPFGDRLGITGGNVYGGGGTGNGPGGGETRSGGAPRFTLARPGSGGGPAVHIVYVVDVSGSMDEGGKMGKAQDALRKALDELRPEDSFNIVTFSTQARSFSPTMRPASSANISQGHLHINLMRPDGKTNVSGALDLALSQSGVTHIFLLSDGDPTEGIQDYDLIRQIARQKNAGRCRIITLALGRGERFKGMDLLRGLADDNNGRFDYVNLSK